MIQRMASRAAYACPAADGRLGRAATTPPMSANQAIRFFGLLSPSAGTRRSPEKSSSITDHGVHQPASSWLGPAGCLRAPAVAVLRTDVPDCAWWCQRWRQYVCTGVTARESVAARGISAPRRWTIPAGDEHMTASSTNGLRSSTRRIGSTDVAARGVGLCATGRQLHCSLEGRCRSVANQRWIAGKSTAQAACSLRMWVATPVPFDGEMGQEPFPHTGARWRDWTGSCFGLHRRARCRLNVLMARSALPPKARNKKPATVFHPISRKRMPSSCFVQWRDGAFRMLDISTLPHCAEPSGSGSVVIPASRRLAAKAHAVPGVPLHAIESMEYSS